MKFVKYQNSGNDFVIVEDFKRIFPLENSLFISQICNRKYGVGSDGLILLQGSLFTDYRMVFFNPDGKEASLCGNGLICLADFISRLGEKKREFCIEGASGMVPVRFGKEKIAISLEVPKILSWNHFFPTIGLTGFVVDIGVPHGVIFVPDIDEIDVDKKGREIRWSREFQPEGINVNFVQTISPKVLKIRTYERGVEGETLSCGSGNGAAAFVKSQLDKSQGQFSIAISSEETIEVIVGKKIEILGKPTLIFEGRIYL
ncbi:MAG: diaminopimelate epimerase [Chlamydiae bacterium]|nr:diaminopimelate epimerase [Chlamydiota bacterium]